jgi:predicted RNase H-like nuclease (RuvC/YqgF family)
VEYVDREVVKEIPVEKIVEKIVNIYDNSEIDNLLKKIEELENRKPEIVEVVKEVPVEVIKEIVIEKNIQDDSKQKKLEQTLQSLKSENINKDRKIEELENKVMELEKIRKNSGAVYLRGSNLDETLYK